VRRKTTSVPIDAPSIGFETEREDPPPDKAIATVFIGETSHNFASIAAKDSVVFEAADKVVVAPVAKQCIVAL